MSNSRPCFVDFSASERQLFLGKMGEQLLNLRTGDISDEIRLSRIKVIALQSRLETVFRETEARKAALVLSSLERETLWRTACRTALAQPTSQDKFSKFLVTGVCVRESECVFVCVCVFYSCSILRFSFQIIAACLPSYIPLMLQLILNA